MANISVIGGGPGGSSAAIRLAQNGHRVRLFEKSRFPRPKLCGGFLSPESLQDLEQLGVLGRVRIAGAVPIHRAVVSSPWGAQVEAPLPQSGLSLSREILDPLLWHRAREVGVELFEGTDGWPQVSRQEWVIVADGRKRNDLASSLYGIQAFFSDVDGITDQVELDLVPGGYVGLVAQGDGRTNICALSTQKDLRDAGPALDHVLRTWIQKNPLFARRMSRAQRLTPWQAVGPVKMGRQRLSEPGRLYTGDAACVVDPFAGEGIAMSLRSSALIAEAFTHPDVATAYDRAWLSQFSSALRLGAVLRHIFRHPILQDLGVGALQAFPPVLTWLAERTRGASLYEEPYADHRTL